jgi:acid phosphatase (class A)
MNYRLINQNYFGGGNSSGAANNCGQGTVPIGVIDPRPHLPTGFFPLLMGTDFARRAWDPMLYAQAVLAEFATTDWMKKVQLDGPPSDPAKLALEIKELSGHDRPAAAGHVSLRAARHDEILAQAQDPSLYWAGMLIASPATRPATWDLIAVATTIGQMVGMHFKLKFHRPRPVQLYPALMPPILTPPHPSYPNNHALQSLLIARFVGLAAPALQDPLVVLAERIGFNREVAGVHYPSDRMASASLAGQIAPFIEQGDLFKGILAEARNEWAGVTAWPMP